MDHGNSGDRGNGVRSSAFLTLFLSYLRSLCSAVHLIV